LLPFSLRFHGHFPDGSGLAATRMSPILDIIGVKDDGGGGDNWSYKTCKAPNRHHQQTNTQFYLQAGCFSCRPTNSVRTL